MSNISLQNFETNVVNASLQQPVLLDIWAPWCGPCKALGPVLERLEAAYEGRFTLTKLNSDEQPEIAGQLSQMFGVRSIPFCVLFKGGQPVDGFVGALPEAQVRSFLDKHVPSAAELTAQDDVAQAQALLAEGDTESALQRLQEALALNPANLTARIDYVRALLRAGKVSQARSAYEPAASSALTDARLSACAHWLAACEAQHTQTIDQLNQAVAVDKRDFAARFELAQIHLASQRFTQALDELLEIVLRDKTWNNELARKTFVAILELMQRPALAPKAEPAAAKGTLELAGKAVVPPSDPVIDLYRRKLSMALF